ncbi:MAG: YfhO family protein [Bacteroidetes bacterium]|nr:YfhO family protein [Bacteroidota bacterium]
MQNNFLKKLLPHFIAVVFFLLITIIYFKPIFFKGKSIKQGDIVSVIGMSKELKDYREANHKETFWTNAMFGGMPTYQITPQYQYNFIKYVARAFGAFLPQPAWFFFIYLLGFYILMCVLKIDTWLGVLGSVAFAFSSYFLVILEAGHITKAHAIGYMPPLVASIILLFRKQYWIGGFLFALFFALEISCNHVQITYYFGIFLILFFVGYFIAEVIPQKLYKHFAIVVSICVGGVLIALGNNATNMIATYSYAKHSTRGQSELTFNNQNKSTGLSKDYITQWSYGIGEIFTFLVPDFKGGASGYIGQDSKDLKGVSSQFKEYVAQSDRYWGEQPFTSGPVYVGAVVLVLFVLGIFIIDGYFKWVLVAGTLLSILLGWGKNFFLTELFIDYFPAYNKFRSVTMILVIAEFCIPLLAVLALDKLLVELKNNGKLLVFKKTIPYNRLFIYVFGGFSLLCVLFYMAPESFNDFLKQSEKQEMYMQIAKSNSKEVADEFLQNIALARINIFKADVLRSLGLLIIAGLVIFFSVRFKVERKYIIATILFIVFVDLWNVNKRYLNDKSFVTKTEMTNPFKLTKASAEILKDTELDYRVLNIAVSTFNDASTSYYHKSIGGYHAAKLKKYQELIDYHIDRNIENIKNTLQTNPTDSSINKTFSEQGVLNMLNMKYLIFNPDAEPLVNPYRLGAAWFVDTYKIVASADSEIFAMTDFNPKKEAIVTKDFESQLPKGVISSSNASIKLESYQPNNLVYSSTNTSDGVAIFSEIYYPSGWNAFIDGKPVEHFKANYVLRGLFVPKGAHKIEFKFESKEVQLGETVALTSFILLIGFGAIAGIKVFKAQENNS